MATKKEAALQVLDIARSLRFHLAGDDDADLAIFRLESLAYDLDKAVWAKFALRNLEMPDVSRKVKLRNLIDHPGTGEAERRAAMEALGRMA